ncbi:MAG: DUF2459 domain-containing protein [Jannaschia sp.]
MRALRRAFLVPALLLCLPLAWFFAGFAGAALPVSGEAPGSGVEIRLISSPIHYDFLLPATPETRAAFAFAAEAGVPVDAPDAAWILAGWGARDFYIGTGRLSDISAGALWSATMGDASVLRVDAFGAFDGEDLPRVDLSPAQYTRLLAAIVATRSGEAPGQRGLTPTDAFFDAEGRFDAGRTCNVWVGEMLRAAGLRFGRWTPTPQAIRLALILHT